MKKAINVLVKNKKGEFTELREKADSFVENLDDTIEKNIGNAENKLTIAAISEQITNGVNQAKRTICFTTRFDVTTHLWTDPDSSTNARGLIGAMERGVKVRMIIDKSEAEKEERIRPLYINAVNKMLRHKNFQYRCVTLPPETIIVLLDDKVASIWTASESFDSVPFVFTDTPSIVNLVKTYFSTIWEKGQAPVPSKTNS